ncbi:MAG: hypothetical protein ACRD1Z_12130 [Vicinamibacteria bacterium]
MGFIKTLFSSKPDKIPSANDPEVEEARRRKRQAAAVARGRQSTIFAGAGGVEDQRLLGKSVLTGPQ